MLYFFLILLIATNTIVNGAMRKLVKLQSGAKAAQSPTLLKSTLDSNRLFNDLMRDYDRTRRPNAQTTIHVRLSMSQIIDVVCFCSARKKCI